MYTYNIYIMQYTSQGGGSAPSSSTRIRAQKWVLDRDNRHRSTLRGQGGRALWSSAPSGMTRAQT
jgi:hypothetical protein